MVSSYEIRTFHELKHNSHYTPTKAGVLSFMQSCAVALGKYSIRANAVLPGTIQTSINAGDLANDEKRRKATERTALGRLGSKRAQDPEAL